MSAFNPNISAFPHLKGKVVVLTGGSSGIGAATVTRLHAAGAKVVFGDISTTAAEDLVSSVTTHSSQAGAGAGELTFVLCNVTNYQDNYNLFRTAYDKYGRVDHAVACAGILEAGKWFDPDLTVETVGERGMDEEARGVLDVNLLGTCVFARIAVVFLRDGLKGKESKDDGGQDEEDKNDRSLTLLASVASFRESAGLSMYQVSKHGVLGLMRTMRTLVYNRDGIRVNCVCPGMTESLMTTSIIGAFREKAYAQTADDVAKIVLGLQVTTNLNGKAIYSEGGKGWEFEDGLWETMPMWLGEEPTKMLRENMKLVASGALLKK